MTNMIACANIGGMETFGECLNSRRLEKGWSISKLARLTGISRAAIYRWEADERVPTPVYRNALRLALGLSKQDDHGWWGSEWTP